MCITMWAASGASSVRTPATLARTMTRSQPGMSRSRGHNLVTGQTSDAKMREDIQRKLLFLLVSAVGIEPTTL